MLAQNHPDPGTISDSQEVEISVDVGGGKKTDGDRAIDRSDKNTRIIFR